MPKTTQTPESEHAGEGQSTGPKRVGKRAVLVGLGMTLFFTWVQAIVRLEWTAGWTDISTGCLPAAAITSLILLIGLNWILQRIGLARWRLNQPELLTVYALVAVAVSISSVSGIQSLPSMMMTQFQGQTAENRWGERITDYVPDILIPKGIRRRVGPYTARFAGSAGAMAAAQAGLAVGLPVVPMWPHRAAAPEDGAGMPPGVAPSEKAMDTATKESGGGFLRSPTELVDWRVFAPESKPTRRYFTDLSAPAYKANFSAFFDGGKGKAKVPWGLLARPLLAWGVYAAVLYLTFFCMMSLVRKQWVDNERLAFPIVIMPLAISQDGGNWKLFSNRMFLLGFIVAFIYAFHLSLPQLLPWFPQLRFFVNLKGFLANKPWNTIPMFLITINLVTFAFAFLVPKDVVLSFVVFNVLMTLTYPFGNALGWGQGNPQSPVGMARWPFFGEVGFGAFTGVLLVGLWMGRGHLRNIVVKAFTGAKEIDDSAEPMSYRLAFFGMIGGICILLAFAAYSGMKLSLAALFFGIFFVYILGITRVRAESAQAGINGPNWWGATPESLFLYYTGSTDLHVKSLAVMANMAWPCGNPTAIMPPHQIEGLKMATEARGRPRKLMLWMIIAVLVAIPLSLYCTFKGYYYAGATSTAGNKPTMFGNRIIMNVAQHIERKPVVDKPGITATLVGVTFSLFLAMMRARFLWWPLHPVGLALGWTFWANVHWFSWLLAWVTKSLTLKFGGASTYRKVMHLCIGILAGSFANGAIWALVPLLRAKGGHWADGVLRLFQ